MRYKPERALTHSFDGCPYCITNCRVEMRYKPEDIGNAIQLVKKCQKKCQTPGTITCQTPAKTDVPNDWYEFVEYGSTNKKSIMIQKLGFSREAALYILAHESDYVVIVDGELKLKNSLQECRSRAVKADFELVKYNLPELFVD